MAIIMSITLMYLRLKKYFNIQLINNKVSNADIFKFKFYLIKWKNVPEAENSWEAIF